VTGDIPAQLNIRHHQLNIPDHQKIPGRDKVFHARHLFIRFHH
jgi:hypothetical protein